VKTAVIGAARDLRFGAVRTSPIVIALAHFCCHITIAIIAALVHAIFLLATVTRETNVTLATIDSTFTLAAAAVRACATRAVFAGKTAVLGFAFALALCDKACLRLLPDTRSLVAALIWASTNGTIWASVPRIALAATATNTITAAVALIYALDLGAVRPSVSQFTFALVGGSVTDTQVRAFTSNGLAQLSDLTHGASHGKIADISCKTRFALA